MTIFEVSEDGKSPRLIEGKTDGQVALFLLRPQLKISVPGKKRLSDLMRAGTPIEEAKAKPDPAA